MKTINISGKKVPLLAVLMALLVIGTASAAVFVNYATLNGTVDVTSPLSVDDIDIGGSGDLTFTSPASFIINNEGDEPVIADIVTTIFYSDGTEVTDYEGLEVDFSVLDVEEDVEEGLILVPPGGLTVIVNFIAAVNLIPDDYDVQVDVNPYLGEETYLTFDGDNAIETLELTHKDGNWNPTGQGLSEINYIPMGNLFCYGIEVTSDDGLLPDTEYALIYYADKPDRFENWGGDNPGFVINIMSTNENGEISMTDTTEMDMSIPHPNDANYDTDEYCEEFGQCDGGAKLWIIPTTHLISGTDLPMNGWDMSLYLFETDLIHYVDTNQ